MIANFISSRVDAPVDNKTGFFLLATFSNKGTLFISEEDTLKTGTKGFKVSTASKSKGVDRKSILILQ